MLGQEVGGGIVHATIGDGSVPGGKRVVGWYTPLLWPAPGVFIWSGHCQHVIEGGGRGSGVVRLCTVAIVATCSHRRDDRKVCFVWVTTCASRSGNSGSAGVYV